MSSEISKVEATTVARCFSRLFSDGLMGEDNDKDHAEQANSTECLSGWRDVSDPRIFNVYRYNIPLALSEPDTEMSLQFYSLPLSAFSFLHLGQQLPTSSSPLSQSLLPAVVNCD